MTAHTASNFSGQASKQVPQRMHSSWSMTWIRPFAALDAVHGALPSADHAGLALLRIDVVRDDFAE